MENEKIVFVSIFVAFLLFAVLFSGCAMQSAPLQRGPTTGENMTTAENKTPTTPQQNITPEKKNMEDNTYMK